MPASHLLPLRWDELDEHRSGGIAPVKLHLFVQASGRGRAATLRVSDPGWQPLLLIPAAQHASRTCGPLQR